MHKKKAGRLQQAYLEYKAHAFTPGPMLLRHRALPLEKAELILNLKIDGLRKLRSLATERMQGLPEMIDCRRYNQVEFGDVAGPGPEYFARLMDTGQFDSRTALELLYRANLSCDLWEQKIIADCTPAFRDLQATEHVWAATGSEYSPWVAIGLEPQLVVHIGCFPDEYLYHVFRDGEEWGSLNDWPSTWTRKNEGGIEMHLRRPNIFLSLAAEQSRGEWAREDPRLERTYLGSDSEEKISKERKV